MNTPTRKATPADDGHEPLLGIAFPRPARLPAIPHPEPLGDRLDAWLAAGSDEDPREESTKLRYAFGLSDRRFVVDLFEGARTVASGIALTRNEALARALDAAELEDA